MRRRLVGIVSLIAASCICGVIIFSTRKPNLPDGQLLIHDVSRLNYVHVHDVIQVKNEKQILKAVDTARKNHLKISIGGARHSQGGQILYPNSVFLDMKTFNHILSLDRKNKTIRVQPGATWADIQNYINPFHLSIKVMQSSNIFTVGGSLSANVHGRDIRFGPLIETVNSFHLLRPNGSIVDVSRKDNPELFRLAIGGYGLFGVILDVELQLTDDTLYQEQTDFMDYTQYSSYFQTKVVKNPDIELHFARLSTAPESFLTDMFATNYSKVHNVREDLLNQYMTLQTEQHIARNKFLFGLSRKSDLAKNALWELEKDLASQDSGKMMIRNNAMRPDIAFLEYDSPKDTDILQEYFVPISEYTSFVDDLRTILKENHVNLLNITVRYLRQNEESVMSYAKADMFALVLYINQGLSAGERKKTELAVRKMVDATLKHNGTYYLPYQLYPSSIELHRAYPNTNFFFNKKEQYDPTHLFMNEFYQTYWLNRHSAKS